MSRLYKIYEIVLNKGQTTLTLTLDDDRMATLTIVTGEHRVSFPVSWDEMDSLTHLIFGAAICEIDDYND